MKLILVLILWYNSLIALDPILILVGPPGSGKGTFSQHLKEHYGYRHVSIGDLLRKEVARQTELGKQIGEIIQRGDFIDPQIVRTLLDALISDYAIEKRALILDGFGRNEGDIEYMYSLLLEKNLLPQTLYIYLEAPDAVCASRIANRLICPGCGHVYNASLKTPCDLCGASLEFRFGDSPEVVLKRLKQHRESFENYFKKGLILFPSILYHATSSLEECLIFYDRLALELQLVHSTEDLR